MYFILVFSESSGSQTLEQFRSLIATEVCDKMNLTEDLRRVEERLAKIEEQLENLMQVIKMQEKARSDIRTLQQLLTTPQ